MDNFIRDLEARKQEDKVPSESSRHTYVRSEATLRPFFSPFLSRLLLGNLQLEVRTKNDTAILNFLQRPAYRNFRTVCFASDNDGVESPSWRFQRALAINNKRSRSIHYTGGVTLNFLPH